MRVVDNAVDVEADADTADTEPLEIHDEDLCLGEIERDAARARAVELVDVPACLRDSVGVADGSGCEGAKRECNVHRPALLQVDTVVLVEISDASGHVRDRAPV